VVREDPRGGVLDLGHPREVDVEDLLDGEIESAVSGEQ